MDDRKRKADTEAVRRVQLRRRAKRGVVAGYIHEISARHQEVAPRETERQREGALATSPRA
jgi:hypothetical protein